MSKKIGGIIIVLVIILAVGGVGYWKFSNQEKPQDILEQYVALLNEHKYDEMYQYLTEEAKQKISQEDFVTRNKNIYEGIDAVDIKNEIQEVTKEEDRIKIAYTQTMSTAAGTVRLEKMAILKKQDTTYQLDWNSSQIFPQLRDTDKVRISTIKATRGKITDRNGIVLAEDGKISSVGIVPGKLGENKEKNIAKIAEITGDECNRFKRTTIRNTRCYDNTN